VTLPSSLFQYLPATAPAIAVLTASKTGRVSSRLPQSSGQKDQCKCPKPRKRKPGKYLLRVSQGGRERVNEWET
jgi:hypothetical protein